MDNEKTKKNPIKKRIFPNGRIFIEDKSRGLKIRTYGTSDIVF